MRAARKCGLEVRHDFHAMSFQRSRRRRSRVVVTGLGSVSPLGEAFVDTWLALLQEQCGITSIGIAWGYQGLEHTRNADVGGQVAAAIPPKCFAAVSKYTEFCAIGVASRTRSTTLGATI
jgi:3-oxoacyl-(acyl-carrier-protein) synthase